MRTIRDRLRRKTFVVTGLAAALTAALLGGIPFAAAPSALDSNALAQPAGTEIVLEWNLNAANLIFAPPTPQPPQQSVPHFAMVHGAIYDAVNAIDGRYEGYLLRSGLALPSDSKDAAAATAGYRVLKHLFPTNAALDGLYATSLAAIPDGPAETRGVAVGDAAAAAMIAARTLDGRFGPFRFSTGTDPGDWRPTPPANANDPNAWLKDVKPFLIRSASDFRSDGPDPLGSRRYARDFAEVAKLGSLGSTKRTDDQKLAANYWALNPPATWNRIFRTLSTQEGLSTVENARFFAMLYLTAADALIAVWEDKERWSFWRPITAIHEADTDGNPRTEEDDNWAPLIANPPYPEHPSGHTGLSGSIVATLQDFFGTDRMSWSDSNTAGMRSFTRFSDAIEEIVDARVWSGIHFRNADEQGAEIGRQVAKYRERHFFERAHRHHDDD